MSSITPNVLKTTFKRYFVSSIIDSVTKNDDENLFFYIARPTGWTDGNEVQQPDTVSANIDSRRQIIAMKAIGPNDINFLIPKNSWVKGTVYDEYTDDLGISGATFHAMTPDFNVYKVISNNNGAQSLYQPQATTTSGTISTRDGYVWKYMFTIPDALKGSITESYIPVQNITTRGLDDVTQRQFDVRANAYSGGIEHIDIDTNGNRYINLGSTLTDTQIGNPRTNVMKNGALANQKNIILPDTDPNAADVSAYQFYTFVVVSGLGAGQRSKIESTTPGTRTITLKDNLTRPISTGDVYQIVPTVVVEGDGVSAEAYLDFGLFDKVTENAKLLRGCRVTNPGKNYSYANASITGPSNANHGVTLDAQMSPLGGHGFDPTREFYANTVAITVNFNEDEGGVTGLSTTNDVLEYGIVRNPILNDEDTQFLDSDGNPVRVAQASGSNRRDLKIESAQASELSESLFSVNNYVIGKDSKATGQILDYLPSNETGYGILRLQNVNGTFVEPFAFGFTGETIAEFSQANDTWDYKHTDRARVVSFQTTENASQTSLVYDCTYQLGVSGDANTMSATTFTRDGIVTGGSGGYGTVLDFKPNQAGTGGVLLLTNVFGTVHGNNGFTLEEPIGMSAGSRLAKINSITKPQIYLKSGEILYSQSVPPIARGPEKMEEYQLLIGF